MSPTAPIISSDSGNLTNTTTPSFSGTAEAGTSIEVFADGALLGTTLANSSGRWDFTVPTSAELTDGRIAITAIATDSGIATELEVTPVRPKYPGATNREYRNDFAFAALKEDGSVVTWGDSNRGGNSSSVTRDLSFGVSEIFSNRQAFAALKEDGSVVTWGEPDNGGDSDSVSDQINSGVIRIFSTYNAFAALKDDGSVVTWGSSIGGGDSTNRDLQIDSDVKEIFTTGSAFAALKEDGSVATWGNSSLGGDSSSVSSELTSGVTQIFATSIAFAALKDDGSVVTWGGSDGSVNSVSSQLSSDVNQIFTNWNSFAALKNDGSVITWNDAFSGGDSSDVSYQLQGGIIDISSTASAFAALKEDGSVVTWGNIFAGGNSSFVSHQLQTGVSQIYSNEYAFAALKENGSVVTWGYSYLGGENGGNSNSVSSEIQSGVVKIFATDSAFAALKEDGSVVTWGSDANGGNSSDVRSLIASNVSHIFTTGKAFAALKDDGSVVTWGSEENGANSSNVSNDLQSGVISFSDPLQDNRRIIQNTGSGSSSEPSTVLILTIDTTSPVFTSAETAAAIDENSGAGQVIYTATSTDSSSVSYSLSPDNNDDAAAFSIDAQTGQVSLNDNPDYESQSDYSFTVVATDAADNSSERPVTLAINDVDTTIFELNALNGSNGLAILGIDEDDRSGTSVSSAGDINGDGIDDLIIGARWADPNDKSQAGESYVVFGSATDFTRNLELSSLDGNNGFAILGINEDDFSGTSVSDAGDINGDGVDDLIIGAWSANPDNRETAGETYVIFGKPNGFNRSIELSSLSGSNGFKINGIDPGDQSGAYVSSAGDINGDGIDDLVIGAASADYGGETYVIFGNTDGFSSNIELDSLNGSNGFKLSGIHEDDRSGGSVSSAGDINGDGIDDLLIGAYWADSNRTNSGETYVVFGSTTEFSSNFDLSDLNGSNGFKINGTGPGEWAGYSVDGGGDVNGDGIHDILISAYAKEESYVVFGSSDGFSSNFELEELNGLNGFKIVGIDGENTGFSVSHAGDINLDGFGDLLIGAFGASPDSEIYAGRTYVIFGNGREDSSIDLNTLNSDHGFIINGIDSGDRSGFSVSSAGDVNGDGIDDFLIGAPGGDPRGDSGAGETYVIFGSTDGFDHSGSSSIVAAPSKPYLSSASDTGSSNSDNLTSATTPTFTGTAEVGTIVELLADGVSLGNTSTDSTGDWSFTVPGNSAFTDGTTLITATARDSAGNSSTSSPALYLYIDTTSPVFTSAETAASIDENSGAGQVIYTATSTDSSSVSYSLSPDNNDDAAAFSIDAQTGQVSLNDNPEYQSQSDYSFTVVATDAAGNSSEKVITLEINSIQTVEQITDPFPAVLDIQSADEGSILVIHGVSGGDQAGISVGSAGDFNRDGYSDLVIGAHRVDRGDTNAGESYVLFGQNNFPGNSVYLSTLNGSNGITIGGIDIGDQFGEIVSGAGDFNDDKYGDVVIVATSGERSTGPGQTGEVYIIFGNNATSDATFDLTSLDGSNGFVISGDQYVGGFGWGGAKAIGDNNGDQIDDIVIGAPYIDSNDISGSGESYVIFGSNAGFTDRIELSSLDGINGYKIYGAGSNDFLGYSVDGAGDINGDGIEDIVVGATYGGTGGEVYVVFGNTNRPSGDIDISSLDGSNGFKITSLGQFDRLGSAVAGIGDFNGDEIDDLLVTAKRASPNGQSSGQSYLIFGMPGGFTDTIDLNDLDGNNGFKINGTVEYENAGYSAAAAGDINGDGLKDIVLGIYQADILDNMIGYAFVVFGSSDTFAESFELSSLNGSNGFRVNGVDPADNFGISVSGAGDFNGDGIGDIVIGANYGEPQPVYSEINWEEAGKAYVIFGRNTDNSNDVDNAAPTAPSTPDLRPTYDTGSSNSDNLTNATTPTFTGTAEVGTTVELFANGVSLGNTSTDSAGGWSFTVPDNSAFTDGTTAITATARDSAGNSSTSSPAVNLHIDTTSPVFSSAEIAAAIDENSGAKQLIYTALATDDSPLTYRLKLKNTDDAASFRIDPLSGEVLLIENPDYEKQSLYSFTVVATDSAGNTSKQGISLSINDIEERTIIKSILSLNQQDEISMFKLKKGLKADGQKFKTAIAGTKNKDKIIGSPAGEIIVGFADKDILKGGEGGDGFLFNQAGGFGFKNRDDIKDFDSNEGDILLFDKDVFDPGVEITLRSYRSKNKVKKAAKSRNDFVYDGKKGLLYFNENGKDKGWGDGGLFAKLQGAPELGTDDFTIV